MKKLLLLLFTVLSYLTAAAGAEPTPEAAAARRKFVVDSLQATLRYQQGKVTLPGGLGELTVPNGFRYLDSAQARHVLTEWWGNPSGESLGMLLPATRGPLDDDSWAFVVQYDAMGYVKDDDADKIDYDDLLKDMQNDVAESNEERTEAGYEAIQLLGWAAKPYYDKDKKALHWAKELQFGAGNERTLNYNLRLLGRRGVLVFNAVGAPAQLAQIRASIPTVIDGVAFAKGMRYSDFNPGIDEVAAYGIGGLVAGKVLAKVGFFALIAKFGKVILFTLLKFWKIVLVSLAGAWTAIKRFFGKKDDAETPALEGGSPPDSAPEA